MTDVERWKRVAGFNNYEISNYGVCPCCKRTFKQLASHMKTKHPEYQEHQ